MLYGVKLKTKAEKEKMEQAHRMRKTCRMRIKEIRREIRRIEYNCELAKHDEQYLQLQYANMNSLYEELEYLEKKTKALIA